MRESFPQLASILDVARYVNYFRLILEAAIKECKGVNHSRDPL
jgi:hypothetical protein